MKKELQDKLYDKYPKIFRQKDLSIKESCMPWGICTDDGWYCLIDNLCGQRQFDTDHNSYPQVEAIQVKEKFGTLRFYYNIIPTVYKHTERQYGTIDGAISFAEFFSSSICERCGSTEEVSQTKGWVKTLCKKCMEEIK